VNIKHNLEKKPEFSGSSAQVLAALQADNRSRLPSFIIRRRRAAQALAASRMAAKVALDKFEARLADAAANHSNYYLEINGESFKLADTTAGYQVYQVYHNNAHLGSINFNATARHWTAHKKHLGKVRRGYFANAAAAVVYLYAVRMRRLHRLGIPRGIKAFHWSGVEARAGEIEREEDERLNELHEQRQIDDIRSRHPQVL